MTRVVRKQSRVELGKTGPAGRAGTLHREHCLRHAGERRIELCHRALKRLQRREHVDHALAVIEGAAQRFPQPRLVVRRDAHVRDRQLDGVLVEARQSRPGVGRDERAVHPQVSMALAARPFREIGVVALAIHHQRREQTHARSPVGAQDSRRDGIHALRLDRHVATRAVLGAELHEQQAQEMVDFGQRGHRALAPAAAGALLDRHRWRNAVDRVNVGTRGRLDELARVGVERLQVAALSFGEHEVEGKSGFAAARDARHDGKAVARDGDVDVLEVVLARMVHVDRVTSNERRVTADGFFRRWRRGGNERGFVVTQGLAGMRAGVRHYLRGRAGNDDFAAGIATFRTEIDDPVGGADDVEVVLDHYQRVIRGEQLAERAQELCHVVEVQAGGGLVEQEQ